MSNKDKQAKGAGRLSDQDADLWARVAGTTKPLRKGRDRVTTTPPVREPAPVRPARVAAKAAKGATPAPAKAVSVPPKSPALNRYDRGEARALAAGRVGIDARIDLHGMRQREAHAALHAFVRSAQAHGHRHLLVITGKGGRMSDERVERGVLNREVPRWLAEPDFRHSVVSVAPAHRRHGGEGALYVRLRKNKPAN